MARRLAAILAADVVGYSRLMEIDETGTLATLKDHRAAFIDPLIAEHGGRIVKLMGDGTLVEFPSVVDAVECAVAVQQGMAERNADTPSDKRIDFRIGVNLGDIIIEGDDIYGDGVNVAARLEGLAEPGGICVSSTVHEHIAGKHGHAFIDDGEQTVKNMSRPVRVWRWSEAEPISAAPPSGVAILPLPDKPSVAVLPFNNMSGDPEQEYFSDGITEDIITEVSRFRELFVTARNSSFAFKGQQVDITNVGKQLGVHFVVEGSVRKAGQRVRITAQLIEAATGNHVWADRYDRDLADIFEVQDEVARMVATTVVGQVRTTTIDRLRRQPTNNMTAYDLYLRGLSFVNKYQKTDEMERLLRAAIELDPNFAGAHALVATSKVIQFFFSNKEAELEAALGYAKTAIDLDPNDSRSQVAMGQVLQSMGRLDEAKVHIDRSLELNANDTWCRGLQAFCLAYLGRLDDALVAIDIALRLDPRGNEWFWDARGTILMVAHRYEEAIDAFQHVSQPAYWSIAWQAICHAKLSQMDQAGACIVKCRQLEPTLTARELADEPFKDRAVTEWLYTSLVELGMPDE